MGAAAAAAGGEAPAETGSTLAWTGLRVEASAGGAEALGAAGSLALDFKDGGAESASKGAIRATSQRK